MNAQTAEGERRMLVLISYILHLLGSIAGLPSLIALVINYVKRDDPPPFNSHHRWMIRTFWWTMLWLALGFLMMVTIILFPLSWLVFGLAWLWWVYRHVRGLIALLDGGRMPS